MVASEPGPAGPLSRSSMEAYGGIIAGLLCVVIPGWPAKAICTVIGAGLSVHLAYQSPWTFKWTTSSKVLLGIVCVLLWVGGGGYYTYEAWKDGRSAIALPPSPQIQAMPALQQAVTTTETLDNCDFNEVLPGYAYFIAARINDLNNQVKQPVFDFGLGSKRIVFYATAGNMFRFAVIDSHNDEHSTDVNLGYDGVRIGVPKLLFFEVGSGTDYSVMRVCSDGVEVSRRSFSFAIDFGNRKFTSFGGSNFNMLATFSFGNTLDKATLATVSQRAA